MTNNIVTKIFNFNTYGYYSSTNRGSLVVYIAEVVADPDRTQSFCFYSNPDSVSLEDTDPDLILLITFKPIVDALSVIEY